MLPLPRSSLVIHPSIFIARLLFHLHDTRTTGSPYRALTCRELITPPIGIRFPANVVKNVATRSVSFHAPGPPVHGVAGAEEVAVVEAAAGHADGECGAALVAGPLPGGRKEGGRGGGECGCCFVGERWGFWGEGEGVAGSGCCGGNSEMGWFGLEGRLCRSRHFV